ncbi:cytochrome P450 [Pseudonocardia sp. N23]|uniref:cytochrome P450 n=1 Tax=Pseudonocardia sp. N23 TaxID=1987376 RepID=UPI0011456316|nr:cytochrome P450 [Pseudonocardia sp. N23]
MSSWAEADEILTSRLFAQESKHESAPLVGGTVLVMDGPAHLRRRRLLAPLMSRTALADHDAVVAATLDDCVRSQAADLVPLGRSVFLQLAASIIGLGDLGGRTPELLALLGPLLEAVTVEWSTRDHAVVLAEGLAARDRLVAGFPLSADGSTLAAIMAAHPGEWDPEAAVREVVLFLAASTLNNAALLVHVVDELSRCPLPDDRLSDALAETLRLYPPTVALLRRALEDVTLRDGRLVRAGEYVAVDLHAANRDPAVFGADADEFRPGRAVDGRARPWGLTFGSGPHLCLGRAVVTGTAVTPGVHLRILRRLRELGVRPDPDRPPVLAPTAQRRHDSYPVLLAPT